MNIVNSTLKALAVFIFLALFGQLSFSQTAELIRFIHSGSTFQVKLNYNQGTLVAEKTYEVSYSQNEFYVTGYNQSTKSIKTFNYKNADPNLSQISLWGAVYVFDGNGNLYHKDRGLAGKIWIDNWVSYIRAGLKFKARLDNNYGTLVAGQIYDVVYTNEEFFVTGFNNATKAIGTWNYNNADPNLNEISLWGAKFQFDNLGVLYDNGNNKAGTIFNCTLITCPQP